MASIRILPMLLALLLLGPALPAGAANITVNIPDDLADPDLADGDCDVSDAAGDQCSLRAAVQEANQTPAADVIFLAPTLWALTLDGAGEDAAATGDLDVTTAIEVRGEVNRRDATFIEGKGAKDRIFDVHPGGSLTLQRLTLLNAKTAKEDFDPGFPGEVSGGCVRSAGTLVLRLVFFYRCSSSDDGGCVSVIDGSATVDDSIFSSCKAKGEGGALEVTALGSASLGDTGVAACKAGLGGAIAARGPLTLRNATLDGNKSKLGGGVSLLGDAGATINSSTLSSNGGVNLDASQTSGTVSVSNSIVWGAKSADCLGAIDSGGGNLEGESACGFTGVNDQQNQDPELLPIGFYPYSPQEVVTRPVLAGSPALDHGVDASCEPTDARAQPRTDVPGEGIDETLCDSGAFEFIPPPP